MIVYENKRLKMAKEKSGRGLSAIIADLEEKDRKIQEEKDNKEREFKNFTEKIEKNLNIKMKKDENDEQNGYICCFNNIPIGISSSLADIMLLEENLDLLSKYQFMDFSNNGFYYISMNIKKENIKFKGIKNTPSLGFYNENPGFYWISFDINLVNWDEPYTFLEFIQYLQNLSEGEKCTIGFTDDEVYSILFGFKTHNEYLNKNIKSIYEDMLKTVNGLLSKANSDLRSKSNLKNNKIYIHIVDEFKIIIKQYLSYFNQYIKRAKQENIKFYVDEFDEGLVLNFITNNENELEKVKEFLSEYIGFTEKNVENIVPHVSDTISGKDQILLFFELKQNVRQYQNNIESLKDQMKVLALTCNEVKKEFNELDFIPAAVITKALKEIQPSIHIEQNQIQTQHQLQKQTQKLQNDLSLLANSFNELIQHIDDKDLKKNGKELLKTIYSVSTEANKENIKEKGILPRIRNYITKANEIMTMTDDVKKIYNKVLENYNTVAEHFDFSLLEVFK